MRGGIVTAARADQVHGIAALAAPAHDAPGRGGRTRSNAVLLSAHCANHRVRRCGRLRDAEFSRIAHY
jgi:hypothetical protein